MVVRGLLRDVWIAAVVKLFGRKRAARRRLVITEAEEVAGMLLMWRREAAVSGAAREVVSAVSECKLGPSSCCGIAEVRGIEIWGVDVREEVLGCVVVDEVVPKIFCVGKWSAGCW